MTSYCINWIVLTLNSEELNDVFKFQRQTITVFVLTFPHNQQINEAEGKRKCVSLNPTTQSSTAITTFAYRFKYLMGDAIRSWLAI